MFKSSKKEKGVSWSRPRVSSHDINRY